MTERRSALYEGTVTHARLDGPRHSFAYPVFLLLIDLDELPALHRDLRLFGWNRRRVVGFRDRDHLDGSDRPLRAQVEAVLAAESVTGVARIELMTHARILGYVFNPVSFFWCYDENGVLLAAIADVHNTFGDRHAYVLPVTASERTVWTRKKLMHVSPFFAPDAGSYRFDLPAPGATAAVVVDLLHGGRTVMAGGMTLSRRPLTDRTLASALLRYPFMTLKVIAAIHFEALRLWRKGAPVHSTPPYDPEAAKRGPA